MSTVPTPSPSPSTWPDITTTPRLLASTGADFCYADESLDNSNLSNHFTNCLWTPDGTTLLTASADNTHRTFIVPPDLLTSPTPLHLKPYTTTAVPSNPYSTAIYPSASLSTPSTFLYLTSCRSSPIRLHSLLHPSLISSYTLVDPNTEQHLPAHSLCFRPREHNTFLSGTENRIALWDLNRKDPVTVFKTIPTRRAPMTTETMRGIVSALAVSADVGVLAAGTFSRQIGLYSDDGAGEVVGVFELSEDEDGGMGVTELRWSVCGRYLYVAERKARAEIQVFDIRVTGKRVGGFLGRMADTNQRLGIEVVGSGEVVAGGEDGMVRVWTPHEEGEDVEAGREPVGIWQASDEPVVAATMHPTGVVMATASGTRRWREVGENQGEEEDEQEYWDNTLRIWEIPRTSDIELMPGEPLRMAEEELAADG
ncbi:WD40 repeat-like protein [Ascodesmis nigricans]|uniref:WD40 repeat-like protein n=1 Tax=Ascodesmis nigricans TaxID=341454 RepID=A0A4S2MT66_9PEZI|nr:WD40 repeat-like protein [Ascodesmis nigricans]